MKDQLIKVYLYQGYQALVREVLRLNANERQQTCLQLNLGDSDSTPDIAIITAVQVRGNNAIKRC